MYSGDDRESECWETIKWLESAYPFIDLKSKVDPDSGFWWTTDEVEKLYSELIQLDMRTSIGIGNLFTKKISVIRVRKMHEKYNATAPIEISCDYGGTNTCEITKDYPIFVYDGAYNHSKNLYDFFGHELAHKLDQHWPEGINELSNRFMNYVGAYYIGDTYYVGDEVPPIYGGGDPPSMTEDFAESFAEYVYYQEPNDRGIVNGQKRWVFIDTLLQTGQPPVTRYDYIPGMGIIYAQKGNNNSPGVSIAFGYIKC